MEHTQITKFITHVSLILIHRNSSTTCIDIQHSPYRLSTGFIMPLLGTMLTRRATYHPSMEMAHRRHGSLMRIKFSKLQWMRVLAKTQRVTANAKLVVEVIMDQLVNGM